MNGPDCLLQEAGTATFEGHMLKLSSGCTHLQQSIRGWITALIQDHLRNQGSSWWWTGGLGQVSSSCSWFSFMLIWACCHCNPCKGTTKCYIIIVEYHILKTLLSGLWIIGTLLTFLCLKVAPYAPIGLQSTSLDQQTYCTIEAATTRH